MEWAWLALAIGLMAVELTTTQLVSVWFAIGAGVTSIVKVIFSSLGFPWQLLIFTSVSLALLIATRPLVKRFLVKRDRAHETNLQLVVGKDAVVVEEINNIKGEGAIRINGLVWSARSDDDSQIPVDEIVIFKEINGNKAIVSKKGE
ncbi:MAG: NfeD family protein [Clostridia bacterium]|nr:NfeD family protein [Clostridia bacterium]